MHAPISTLGRYSLTRALKVFAVIGLLLIASGTLYCWWKTRPISTLTFKNGSKVHLMRITHGRVHDYRLSGPGDFFAPIRELYEEPQPYRTLEIVTAWHLRFEPKGTVRQVKAMGGMEDPIILDCDNAPVPSSFARMTESLHRSGPVTLVWSKAYKQRGAEVEFSVRKDGLNYPWFVPNPQSAALR